MTYASVFGDDPNAAVNELRQARLPGGAATGGFVTGAAAIDGIATAIRRAKGSTNGAALARSEKFKGLPTISGEDQLLAGAAQGVRARVPRDRGPEQQAEVRRLVTAKASANI